MSRYTGKFATAARLLLGVIFFVFGLNGFLGFLPSPSLEGDAAVFIGGLAAAPYMFPLIKGTEVLVGIALFSGRFVPLALVLLAPISVNIFLFHAVLSPGLGLPLFIVAAQLFLAWFYRDTYRPLFHAQTVAAPADGRSRSTRVHVPAEAT